MITVTFSVDPRSKNLNPQGESIHKHNFIDVERVLNLVLKNQIKVITRANQRKENFSTNQWKLKTKQNNSEALESPSDRVAICFSLHLTGLEEDARCMEQSQGLAMEIPSNP